MKFYVPYGIRNEVVATVAHEFPDELSGGDLVVTSVEHTGLHAPDNTKLYHEVIFFYL